MSGEDFYAFCAWQLEAWRADALPAWRRIRGEARAAGDAGREAYADALVKELEADEARAARLHGNSQLSLT